MCLDRITKRYTLKERKTVYGWKIFRRNDFNGLFLSGLFMGGGYLPGMTYTATRGKIIMKWCHKSYPTGFHVYANRKEAECSRFGVEVYKVKLSQVQTRGIQDSLSSNGQVVYVGRRMKILKPERDKND